MWYKWGGGCFYGNKSGILVFGWWREMQHWGSECWEILHFTLALLLEYSNVLKCLTFCTCFYSILFVSLSAPWATALFTWMIYKYDQLCLVLWEKDLFWCCVRMYYLWNKHAKKALLCEKFRHKLVKSENNLQDAVFCLWRTTLQFFVRVEWSNLLRFSR